MSNKNHPDPILSENPPFKETLPPFYLTSTVHHKSMLPQLFLSLLVEASGHPIHNIQPRSGPFLQGQNRE